MRNKILYIAILLILCMNCKPQKENNINCNITEQEDTLTVNDSTVNDNNVTNVETMNNCIRCKIDAIKEVKNNIDNLTEEQAYNFLCCIDESCSNNVEFTEFSNEILYLLLYKRPELVLRILNIHSNISLNYIKKQLENPVNDKIDLYNVYKSIEDVGNYEAMKKELLSSIQLAMDKYN